MVTLALLDPLDEKTVLEWWVFEQKTEITVGRSSQNDVVIRDPRVSRHHLILEKLPVPTTHDEWQLTNRGKNNVSVNGDVTFRTIVPQGAVIQLAPHGLCLRFFVGDQAEADRLIKQGTEIGSTITQNPPQADPPTPLPDLRLDSGGNFPDLLDLGALDLGALDLGALDLGAEFSLCRHRDTDPNHLFCRHCGSPLRVQRSIRQYDLLQCISQSGQANTFLAWVNPNHPDFAWKLGEPLVVLKHQNPEHTDDSKEQELFIRQATTLNKLNHQGVPSFIDFFTELNQFCLVMEWIPGQSLEQYVQDVGVLKPEQAVACILQVCDVLAYLQHQNPPLVHRDIKPANLIVRHRDGRIVLVDFGVVKPLLGQQFTQLPLGGYRAPEQMYGQTFPQSDFFALGATLLFLLTKKDPARIHGYRDNNAKRVVRD